MLRRLAIVWLILTLVPHGIAGAAGAAGGVPALATHADAATAATHAAHASAVHACDAVAQTDHYAGSGHPAPLQPAQDQGCCADGGDCNDAGCGCVHATPAPVLACGMGVMAVASPALPGGWLRQDRQPAPVLPVAIRPPIG